MIRAMLALTLATGGFVVSQADGTASGFFRMDQTTSTFTTACAFTLPRRDDTEGLATVVVLATHAIDCAAVVAAEQPAHALDQALEGEGGEYVMLWLAAGADDMDGEWTQPAESRGFGFKGKGEVIHSVRTDTRVEGSYRSNGPITFFRRTYEFDMTWAVDVQPPP
jgi:hypothetical protein